MKIALYSRTITTENQQFIADAIDYLNSFDIKLYYHANFTPIYTLSESTIFSTYSELKQISDLDFIFSFGGDGTFIDTTDLIADLNVPIVGINTGRIGFLTGINKNNYKECIQLLIDGNFSIESRSVLHVECSQTLPFFPFAFNDITVRPSEENSINAITATINNEFINTYWADGLIISTPSGSTAYSLSCGGPILHPSTDVLILTPIASHTLAVRPIVIPADGTLKLKVDSRSNHYSLALDCKRIILENSVELTIKKAPFSIKTVQFHSTNFYNIIREKLLWGLDRRNITT